MLPFVVQPFNIILAKTYVESMPRELQEAAEIDGANILQVFFRVYLPNMTPILATIAIFSAVTQWNSFQDTLIYITDQSLYTLQYLLYMFINQASSLAQAAQNAGGNLGQIAGAATPADADLHPDDRLGARRAAHHLRLSPVPALLREGHHAGRRQGLTAATPPPERKAMKLKKKASLALVALLAAGSLASCSRGRR